MDTARNYTISEYRIGLALQEANRPVIVSSQSLVRRDKIYEDVKESLRQLKVKKRKWGQIFILDFSMPF